MGVHFTTAGHKHRGDGPCDSSMRFRLPHRRHPESLLHRQRDRVGRPCLKSSGKRRRRDPAQDVRYCPQLEARCRPAYQDQPACHRSRRPARHHHHSLGGGPNTRALFRGSLEGERFGYQLHRAAWSTQQTAMSHLWRYQFTTTGNGLADGNGDGHFDSAN